MVESVKGGFNHNMLFDRVALRPKGVGHGTHVAGLTRLQSGSKIPESNADEFFGRGVYAAVPTSAERYALLRARSEGVPTVYEFDILGKRLFDFRKVQALFDRKDKPPKLVAMLTSKNPATVAYGQQAKQELLGVLRGFAGYLKNQMDSYQPEPHDSFLRRQRQSDRQVFHIRINKLLETLENNTVTVNQFREVLLRGHNHDRYDLSDFLQSKGYDGMIGLETADWARGKAKLGNVAYVLYETQGIAPSRSYRVPKAIK